MLILWQANKQMSNYVIIVAGGKGLRMGTDIPKQFLPIAGRPVLMRTIERFKEYDASLKIILVLPKHQQEYWKDLCRQYTFAVEHKIVDGGETRFHSSKNGISAIPENEEGYVAIHDGVRPFVSCDTIARCFDSVEDSYAVIPVMQVTSTLRYVDPRGGSGNNVDRSLFREVQTPQVFDIALARQAFNQPYRETFTDDASVIESLGCKVAMVDGNRENIKITTPMDLKIAEVLLNE